MATELNSRHDGGRGEGGGRGRGGGGNNGGGRNYGEGGSAGEKGAAGARGKSCYICDSHEYFWRTSPEPLCQRCEKKGQDAIYCKVPENSVMAVDLTGGGAVAKYEVVETDDESAVGSEAECEAFITLNCGTGE